MNDQRRAFSNVYVNQVLSACACCVEISEHSPLSRRNGLTAEELRPLPCILIASPGQRENEQIYYREIVGLDGEFLFAENLEQARLLAAGGKSFVPVEGVPLSQTAAPLLRVPFLREGKPILRTYCAFWNADNPNPYIEEFHEILNEQFT